MIKHYRFCFLYKPGRFGKTLLLDTVRSLFRGEKDLFEKLWIGKEGRWEWPVHPIINLDFKIEDPDSLNTKGFREFLLRQVRGCGLEYGLNTKGINPSLAFEWLVDALFTKYGHGVVILIDNYDNPLVGQFRAKEQRQRNKRVIVEFLSKLDPIRFCLRFVLMAGQFRFPGRSIYPAVPRPFDLSFNSYFASLCGVTPQELDKFCYEHMAAATAELKASGVFGQNKTIHDFRRAILYNHNGYSFDGDIRVLNPHALMHTLKYKRFDDSAYDLAPPLEQVGLIKNGDMTFDVLGNHHYVTRTENAITVDERPVLPYLLHTGYMTVKRIRPMKNETHLMLCVPNHYIRGRLYMHLLADGRKPATLDILRNRRAIVYRSLKSLSVLALETAFKVLVASVQKPMYVSEQDYFNKDLYLAMRMLFQAMDVGDPRQDGVIEGAIDFPGGDVFIVQLRAADREWVPLEREPFINGDITKIRPPWRLPATLRVLETDERFNPFWVELNAFMDLQAQMGIQQIGDKKYPERFFPYVSPSTRVFKVGVAVYQRLKVRVIIEQATRPPDPSR
jgi:hypothetical protein